MTVTIVNTWTGGYAPPGGFFFPRSATAPSQVGVANVPGDWMIAVAAWLQPLAGAGTSMALSDDVHDWWEPVAADSSAAGLARCSVWAAPAAQAAAYVQAAPTGAATSSAVAVYDVSGIGPGWAPQAVASASGTRTNLVIGGGTAPVQSLVITVFGANEWGATITPPAGWTALTGSTILGVSNAPASITVAAAYQVITGAIPSATWTVSGSAVALAGITVAIPLAAAVPALKSPDWPAVITEAAIGAGPQSAPSSLTWTDMSARSLALQVQQGRQYSLSQLQAAQGTITLDNPDGALIPPGTGSFAGIDSGTPVRRRCYWPGGAWQVQFSGDGVTATPKAEANFPRPAVTPGNAYAAGASLASSAPWASGMALGISWKNSGGGSISTVTKNLVPSGPAPALVAVSGTAPAGAVTADIFLQANGTPPASITFSASAAPPVTTPGTTALATPPGVGWGALNNATVTTLAPWQPDPRGAPSVTPWSVPFSGYFRRWPFNAPGALLRGQTVAEVSDIWAYATGSLDSMAREELEIDSPYALWPLDDAPGAPAGSNIAPGNGNALNLITAKLGAGGATQQWGQNSGALIGDGSSKTSAAGRGGLYQLTLAGTSLNTQGYGYALTCTDPKFPQLSGGVTIETWFSCTANSNLTGFGFSNSGNTLTVPNSSFPNGTPVVFTSSGPALPTGMTAGVIYYVINQSGASFQISTTIGGSVVTLSTNSAGFVATTTPWNPVVMAMRNATGSVFSVQVHNTDGSLFVSGKAVATTVIDTSRDWRQSTLIHMSASLTATTWKVVLNGGSISASSGSLTSAPPWTELCLGGVIDRLVQGFCMPGQLALACVYPYALSPNRVVAHYWGATAGLKQDPAHERLDRVLGYAGIAGRRWIGQQGLTYELDLAPSGQDIGGQSAATAAGNVAASTVPATLYVAPTGDIAYWGKQFAWNQPVKWTLGDNVAGGEIPFSLAQFSTDYDPTRVYNDVQLTQLDSKTVTVPAGATASSTVAAMVAASQAQYGDQPYQQTAYLLNDYSAAYTAGSGLVDLAAWIAMVYGRPRNRVPGVTVNAAAYPAAWPLWSQAAVGDMVQVNVRLPTAVTSPVVSVVARVTQTRRAMKWDTEGAPAATIDLTLDAAPEYLALTCDDAVRGVLNGQSVLAWLWLSRLPWPCGHIPFCTLGSAGCPSASRGCSPACTRGHCRNESGPPATGRDGRRQPSRGVSASPPWRSPDCAQRTWRQPRCGMCGKLVACRSSTRSPACTRGR